MRRGHHVQLFESSTMTGEGERKSRPRNEALGSISKVSFILEWTEGALDCPSMLPIPFTHKSASTTATSRSAESAEVAAGPCDTLFPVVMSVSCYAL